MKIDLSSVVNDFDGQPVSGVDKSILTFSHVIKTALLGFPAKSAAKKGEAFALGLKLFSAGETDLSPEEAVLIKEAVDAAWPSPLIYGRISEALR